MHTLTSSRFGRFSVCLIAVVMGTAATRANAQSVHNVLVVVNDSSPASREIGQYYADARGLPETQVVRVRVDPADDITRAEFERRIERPIGQWLGRYAAYDRILYIVLTKGIPLRIQGTAGKKGTVSSVDSELTLLYRKLVGIPISPDGPIANPYFLGNAPPRDARTFSHERHDIYLVTRLDGFTVTDVKALIDRSARPATMGTIVLDQRSGSADVGDRWLEAAADRLVTGFADRVRIEKGVRQPDEAREVLGYYSWGSNDPAIRAREPNVSFAAGALGGMFASGDARTFTEPPAAWTIGDWQDERSYFAGAPGSLTGDLIRRGITGIVGSVADPYLEGSIRPDIIFPAYLSGRSLAESFYLAMPFLSWQTVVIGDPLCALSHDDLLRAADADPAVDPLTELPAPFAARRLRFMAQAGIKLEALQRYLRAESRLRAQDDGAARQALEEATAIDDQLAPAHLVLAGLYEQAHEYDKAIERYRRVLAHMPNDAIALNNLAYTLAVRRNEPREALPLAEKAYALASANPSIVDTLGWIHHLLGDDAAAAPLLSRAIDALPDSAELHLHAAIVFAAIGQIDAASTELTKAVALDQSVGSRAEVTELRLTLDTVSR